MPIFKSIPIKKIINNKEVFLSDNSIIVDSNYKTCGESTIIVKNVDVCNLFLDDTTTEHVVIKALTKVNVESKTLIDEEFSVVELDKGSCVEFKKVGDFWYILSSDGLKND